MGNKTGSNRIGILATGEIELIRRADNRENLCQERKILWDKESRTKEEDERLEEINKEIRMISSRLSDLVKVLHKRIMATENDLVTILKSQSLRPLVIISNKHLVHFPFPHDGDYDNYGIIQSLDEIYKLNYVQHDGTESNPNYSTWQVRFKSDLYYGTRHYWLDANVEPIITSEDISSPDYSMKGIKGRWTRKIYVMNEKNKEKIKKTEKIDSRAIIREALELEKRYQGLIKLEILPKIFPRNEDDAINIMEIRNKISLFHKIKKEFDFKSSKPMDPKLKDDQSKRELERRMAKGREDMKIAYSAIESDIEKIQQKLKKRGLKLVYSTSDLNDY